MADEYSIVPVKSSKCTMNPLFSVLFLGLACVSTIFQILAFSTHGWVVMTEFLTDNYTDDVRSVEIYTGLWYTVKCENGACSSVTHHEAFKEDIANGNNFKGSLSCQLILLLFACSLRIFLFVLFYEGKKIRRGFFFLYFIFSCPFFMKEIKFISNFEMFSNHINCRVNIQKVSGYAWSKNYCLR